MKEEDEEIGGYFLYLAGGTWENEEQNSHAPFVFPRLISFPSLVKRLSLSLAKFFFYFPRHGSLWLIESSGFCKIQSAATLHKRPVGSYEHTHYVGAHCFSIRCPPA